jgi:hypothetical protein
MASHCNFGRKKKILETKIIFKNIQILLNSKFLFNLSS